MLAFENWTSRICSSIVFLLIGLSGHASATEQKDQRVVTLSPHAVEMLYAIDAGHMIVGTTMFSDYPASAKEIPVVGGYSAINVEAIIALKPDLIVTWQSGNPDKQIKQLAQFGVNTYDSDPQILADVADDILALGKLVGREAQAARFAATYLDKLTELRLQHQDATPVSVFYQLWPKPLRSVAQGSWIQQTLAMCGADNIFATAPAHYPLVNLETIITADPEVIFVTDETGQPEYAWWQQWPNLRVVKSDQVFELNSSWLHRAGPRSLLGVEQVCQYLDEVRQRQQLKL
ncbi:cobalamin-binding protein [Motilimonas pumila]|uniref:Cobalamin-binding protein n=1 Tax=Motilimonas pumila TaxID=2303987 RepID=A0A418YDC4_9GAMM|nr:cobalamin-binding protein [Motilimonas pumila]RJG42533.1 cobalamin-binding protein [Motilimonas pumila]